MKPFDLSERAPNGLRRGFTTGSCATAGVKAALLRYLFGEDSKEVDIVLPNQENTLQVPIENTALQSDGATARVIKDGGDDPDQTHSAAILARVTKKDKPGIEFLAGAGVGVVRQAGLQLSIGEPAINPVPRAMIRAAVEEVCADIEDPPLGFVIEIGCEGGEAIAKRTFNPRLGIEGGISILGTSGIVEPKSLASFKASIEIYINVALAESPEEVVLSPGNLGQRFARESLDIELRRVVQVSNFVGFALDHLSDRLMTEGQQLSRLWVVGHPGKLAKLIDGHWDTHSQKSPPATKVIHRIAGEMGIALPLTNTVEECVGLLGADHLIWKRVAEQIRDQVERRIDGVSEIRVGLFSMSGESLNGL